MVEHVTENHGVGGSIPSLAINKIKQLRAVKEAARFALCDLKRAGRMNLSTFGITATSRRDVGTRMEYTFGIPAGSEPGVLMSLLETMAPGEKPSVIDPAHGDCSLEARRNGEGSKIRRA